MSEAPLAARRALIASHRSMFLASVVTGLALISSGGCVGPKTSTVKTAPPVRTTPSPAPAFEADPDLRVRELQRQAAELAAVTNKLPANTSDENRNLLKWIFTSLNQLLPLVQVGPHGGVFDHQVTVVALTRTELANSSSDLAYGPLVDRGLRAVYNALDDAQHSGYYEDPAIRGSLDRLTSKIGELDSTRGPEHDVVWGQAFNLVSDVISRMGASLAARLANTSATAPTTAATTEPAAPSDASPATSPAAPASPEPAAAPTSAPTTGP